MAIFGDLLKDDYFAVFIWRRFLLCFEFFNFYCLYGWIGGNVLCKSVLSCNSLVSPSMIIENFAGYTSLGWHLCSLRLCITSGKDLLLS